MIKTYLLPIVAAITLTFIVLWQVPLKGLVPFPGDLLIGRFFPWNTQSYPGFDGSYKEFISADTIRQTYPWRRLAIDQLKNGDRPNWNPYAFAGTPLLANMQSAPFYPLNLLYIFGEFNLMWIIQVLLQPILAIWFTYLLARQLKISPLASLLSGLTFAFCGYQMVWLELNTVGHAGLWLPLILYALIKAKRQPIFYALVSFGLLSSILANHVQTSLFVFLLTISFFIYSHWQTRCTKRSNFGKHLSLLAMTLVISVGLSSVQLLPALELMSLSARAGADEKIFTQFQLPFSHLVTLISPNYFGNPATNNYFGRDYGEFMAYFGLIPLLLALLTLFRRQQHTTQKFFSFWLVAALVLALPTVIGKLPFYLHVPILQSSAPARWLFVMQFSGAILAGFGFDYWLGNTRRTKKILTTSMLIIVALMLTTLVRWKISDTDTSAQAWISLRNLFYPTLNLVALITATLVLSVKPIKQRFKRLKSILAVMLLLIVALDLGLFSNRYLPFSKFEFMFPNVRIFTELERVQNYDRFFGDYTASVTSNTWLVDKVYAVEGYDSLFIKEYGELLNAAANDGVFKPPMARSDANLANNNDNFYRQRLQNILGVAYILDKNDSPSSSWEVEPDRFPPHRYELIWQLGKFKIYQNIEALPRAFLVSGQEVISDKNERLKRFFDASWDPTQTILLQSEPSHITDLDGSTATGSAQIVSYATNRIVIKTQSERGQWLFLSDVWYPNWKASVDGKRVPIEKANYIFRAVWVDAGEHEVVMEYR